MKTVAVMILMFAVMTVILTTNGVFAADRGSDEESERIFQSLDEDHDGKISKDEWNAVDANRDGKITPKEWERYHLKSSKTIKWFDKNGDGSMDRDEFLNNFKK